MYAIETRGLTKYYGKVRGIEKVDLQVEEGDFFGFIGPNGAGKSTTIRTLLGLISPTGGTARVLGRDILKEKIALLEEVGYLPAEASLYGSMRAGELIALSASLRKKDCKKEAADLCERLQLDPGRRIGELSLGNRKKVGIVCALQHRPRLYVLDEPTSGLDPLMQQEFYALLKERCQEGATVFLSSHALSEVAKHCRRAAVIRDGRVLVSDRVDKLGQTGVKRVILRGVTRPPALEGMRNLIAENDTISFLYNGSPAQLLAALAPLPLTDFTVSDPDLEEVFMHFYEKGAQ